MERVHRRSEARPGVVVHQPKTHDLAPAHLTQLPALAQNCHSAELRGGARFLVTGFFHAAAAARSAFTHVQEAPRHALTSRLHIHGRAPQAEQ